LFRIVCGLARRQFALEAAFTRDLHSDFRIVCAFLTALEMAQFKPLGIE
jgi:hypothetical protein